MPQDNPRTERLSTNRKESSRVERSRSERSSASAAARAPLGDMVSRSVRSGLPMHKEMFDVLQEIGRGWFARAASEAEMAFKLPNKLTAIHSMPDALTVYQEWLGEWINMFGEDGRRFLSDTYKIMDTGVRCFADSSPH